MQERLRNLLNRIIEWWNKFTTKQKTLIASIAAAVVVALVILAYVVTRPTMVTLAVAETAADASEIVELLEDNNISYETSTDGLTITINAKDEAQANLILGSNGIPTEGYSIDNVFDGSFSTTEADKQKRYQLYREQKMADELVETQEAVDGAKVSLSIPDNDGTILSAQEDTYVSIILTLNQDIDEDNATAIAKFAATAVGNEDTENILIMDSNSNVLFSGADSTSTYGVSSSYQALQTRAEADIKSDVSDVLLGSTLFDNVEIGLNLVMDFDTEEKVDTHYYTEDGMTQGYIDEQTTYNSESTEGSAAVPGTDSNDSTTYVIDTDDTTYDVLPLDLRLSAAIQGALNRLADSDNCVIVGRCANYYLRNRKNAVILFVTDSENNKIRRIMKRRLCDEETARKYAEMTDKRREDVYSYFTGEQWDDADNYDICVNTGVLGEEGTAHLITELVNIKQKQM